MLECEVFRCCGAGKCLGLDQMGTADNTAGFIAGKASILSAHFQRRMKAGLTDNTAGFVVGEASCVHIVSGG